MAKAHSARAVPEADSVLLATQVPDVNDEAWEYAEATTTAMTPTTPRKDNAMTASRTARPFTAVLAAGGAALALLAGVTLGSMGVPSGWSLSPRDAHAQEERVPESAGITIIGDAVVKAKPDTTTLRLGVDATAQTPAAALSQTRDTTERVLQRLRERGVPEADLQTSGLNVFRMQTGPLPGRRRRPPPTAATPPSARRWRIPTARGRSWTRPSRRVPRRSRA